MLRTQASAATSPLPLAGGGVVHRAASNGPWIRFGATFLVHFVLWLAIWAVLPSLLGWRSVALLSGSMAPTLRAGDVLVYEPSDGRSLGPGTVILFERADDRHPTAHRIVDVQDDGRYVTWGDGNPAADSSPVAPSEVRGVGRLLVPLVGLPTYWWAARDWVPLILVTVLMVGAFAMTVEGAVSRGSATGATGAAGAAGRGGAGRRRALVVVGLVAAVILGGSRLANAAYSTTTASPGNSWAAAAVFCDVPGSQTVTSVADSFVLEDKPTENHGTDTTMAVKSDLNKANRALVRFDLPTIPSGCALASATLRFYTTTSKTGLVYGAWQVAASWDESVNWNTQPGTTGTPATAPTTSNGWGPIWTVTTQVQAMYSGANYGFLVKDLAEGSTSNSNKYSTREGAGANRPQLIVTWS